MDRRKFLGIPSATKPQDPVSLAKNRYANKKLPRQLKKAGIAGLDPYTGTWGKTQAKHLLNRTMFGATKEQYDTVAAMNLNTAIDLLLNNHTEPAPPVNDYSALAVDSDCAVGETWVNKGLNEATNPYRVQSLTGWWLGLLIDQPISIHEKMTLFWHNHFVTSIQTIAQATYAYKYNKLLRDNAMGNVKDFTKAITINPAMLFYLNGYLNNKYAPDENYARELFELFTVGKGPDSGYTEDDVKEAARLLTGFTIDVPTEGYTFIPDYHDTGDKTFSSFFNNTTISGKSGAAGAEELDDLLTMIFNNQETARHLARKLYRWFVYYVIDEEVEEKIIEPLADALISNNYEIKPTLELLLKSEHFFENYSNGCLIKNPVDYICSLMKHMEIELPETSALTDRFYAMYALNQFNTLLGMQIGSPPSVAGWEAYHVSPIYHEFWINSITLSFRNQLSDLLLSPTGYVFGTVTIRLDVMAHTEAIPNAGDPNELIAYLTDIILPFDFDQDQIDELKSILLSGQAQDHYWTDAWNIYLSDPSNQTYYYIVYVRLFEFYKYLLNQAEYQLS